MKIYITSELNSLTILSFLNTFNCASGVERSNGGIPGVFLAHSANY